MNKKIQINFFCKSNLWSRRMVKRKEIAKKVIKIDDLNFQKNNFYTVNLIFVDEKNIKNILKSCFIDEKFFFKEIKKSEIKDKLKQLTTDAFEKDIFGAPTFVVNDQIFWGQDRLDYALDEYDS